MANKFRILFVLIMIFSFTVPVSAKQSASSPQAPSAAIPFTILHTNDFHGQLEFSGSNPGMARVSSKVNEIRTAKGDANVLLVDAGDEMQGSLLSNLQKGIPTIAVFNTMSYDVATFGNHEFDWGQSTLIARVTQADYDYVSANIVVNDTGNCATAGWTSPSFATPYVVKTIGTAPNSVRVAFVGVTTIEVPSITIAEATAGLCFKDPTASIQHYYAEMKANADVLVVLSHLGYADGGYGYGIPVIGDQTLAKNLITAGQPVNLIIGGHSHSNLTAATVVTVAGKTGSTAVVQAYYNGRTLGQADMTFDPVTNAVTVSWIRNQISTSGPVDPVVAAKILEYSSIPAYQTLINTPIGYTAVDLPRLGGTVDNMMGTFVDDAIFNYLNTDADPTNDVDLFFNNAGGIRTDLCAIPDPANPGGYKWSYTSTDCHSGVHDPVLLKYEQMFTILPFGNVTTVGEMTGAQIQMVLDQAPRVAGVIQPAGIDYKYYSYKDALPGPQPFAWGAFEACVVDKVTQVCEPLVMDKVYKVGTNEFLAPGGGDGYLAFKYMNNPVRLDDMLNNVNAWISANHGTPETAYKGPNGDGTLDGRILRDGTSTLGSGTIIPLTILHHNDSHGNLVTGPYVAYPQLATLIKQERLHNPGRTMLLSSGDNIQGDAMMYYFKSAALGYAADGTPLPPSLQTHPMMAVMNAMGYDAWTLGNHEFNFGKDIFTSVLKQAAFPTLQANLEDTGEYGIAQVPVQDYITKNLGGINVAVMGIGNHRVPNYELPSNIPGLTFTDPLVKAQELSDQLNPDSDVVIALTHIGFTEDPKSVEVDKNVDTNMAAQVGGLDAIIGGHSHTNPATGYGFYKFLPTLVADPDDKPVIINHAYRYNNTLGEVILGVRPKAGGGYEVVTRTGQYLSVTSSTLEDPDIKAIVAPYVAAFSTYNNKVVGQTTVPIDALQAFTKETNAANLQADSAVFALEQTHGIDVDFHLSGAMTNRAVATSGPYPVTLKVSDMFTLMPYENSLVVLEMNGVQLKAVLERAFRNYYYYKYVSGYGGYSYYTTCMLDIDSVGKITYNDLYPAAYDPAKSYVVSLEVDGEQIDFTDETKFYRVSTVNYLAAGSCNFNNGGVSLWPLDQIVADTQYYVRDVVIEYIDAMDIVSPAIEGRLSFITDTTPPVITITSPTPTSTGRWLTLDFGATDDISGVGSIWADLDGIPVTDGQVIDTFNLTVGDHTLTVNAVDKAGNSSSASVTFSVTTTPAVLISLLEQLYIEGKITKAPIFYGLMNKVLDAQAAFADGDDELGANLLNAFINKVEAQRCKTITCDAADLLIAEAEALLTSMDAVSALDVLQADLVEYKLLYIPALFR